jgi:hypothetical protein
MRLWVDFNDIEDEDYVEANLDFAQFFREEDLQEGVAVGLFDGGGHECQGVVEAVDSPNRLVRVKLNWNTWWSPAQRRVYDFRQDEYATPMSRLFIPNPAA